MTDDPHTPDNGETTSSEPNGPTSEKTESFDDISKAVKDAFKSGSEDARKAFDKAVPRAKDDIARGVHDIAYAIAYATAFGGELLKEFTPENVTSGFSQGSEAGRRAAGEVIAQRRAREAEQQETPEPGAETFPA